MAGKKVGKKRFHVTLKSSGMDALGRTVPWPSTWGRRGGPLELPLGHVLAFTLRAKKKQRRHLHTARPENFLYVCAPI